MKGKKTVAGTDNDNIRNKKTLNNNASFRSCISKINYTFIDYAENLDIVLPMYHMLEYSGNYAITTGSLWNYHRDDANENNAAQDINK